MTPQWQLGWDCGGLSDFCTAGTHSGERFQSRGCRGVTWELLELPPPGLCYQDRSLGVVQVQRKERLEWTSVLQCLCLPTTCTTLNTEHSCIQPGHSAPSPKEQGVSSPLVRKGISTAGPKGSKGLQSAASQSGQQSSRPVRTFLKLLSCEYFLLCPCLAQSFKNANIQYAVLHIVLG